MTVRRPIVGLSAYEEAAAWTHWRTEAVLVPSDYVRAIERAGGLAILLPSSSPLPGELLEIVDAVVLTGGPDLAPASYGALADPRTGVSQAARDQFELDLTLSATEQSVPLLGICRGLQVLNVARGGTLHQHLPDVVGNNSHQPVLGGYGHHDVYILKGSALEDVLGTPTAIVPTHHHQGVDRLGKGLAPVAWAADGTIEALEDPSRPFLVAVQWHPEVGEDPALFDGLVLAARQAMNRHR